MERRRRSHEVKPSISLPSRLEALDEVIHLVGPVGSTIRSNNTAKAD
jgi:hypothetical protein